jgi:hypothetical protein
MNTLGMKKMPAVGKKLLIMAHAHVASASEHETPGEKRRNLELQITHLHLDDQGKGPEDVADSLYGKGEQKG